MKSAGRYSPLAWAAAVAVCSSAWAGYFSKPELSAAAFVLSVLGIGAWIVTGWAQRLARRALAGETQHLAVLRATSFLAFAVFGLYTIAAHGWALVFLYAEPAINRVYAETLGFEFGPYLLASLAGAVVATVIAVAAIRALRVSDPARAAVLWPVWLLAPAAWLAIAAALDGLTGRLRTEWSAFGADLPAPTLLLLEFEGYWCLPVALALGLCGVAWFMRSRPAFFRWTAVAQLFVLLMASACFTLAIISIALPVFKMCGAV